MQRIRSRAANARLPFDLYRGLVAAVYRDVRPLMLGGLLPAAAAALCAARMESPLVAGCALVIAGAFALRLFGFMKWSRTDANTWKRSDARAAARSYSIQGVVMAASISLGGFVILQSGDALSQLIMFAAVLANVVGTVARNFAFSRLVDTQLFLFMVPPCLALWQEGPIVLALMAMSALAILTFRLAARDLRSALVQSIMQARTAQTERDLFNDALASLPVGVIMVDAEARCRVTNASALAYVGLEADAIIGRASGDVLDGIAATGVIDGNDIAAMRSLFNEHDEPIAHHELVVHPKVGTSRSERRVRMTRSVLPDGGSTSIFEDVTDRVRAAHAIDRMSRFDRLTGLLNREQLNPALSDVMREPYNGQTGGGASGLMVLDLTGFERINAMHGREVGDDVLRAVGRVLQASLRGGERVLRIGGDRFAMAMVGADMIETENRTQTLARELTGGQLARAVAKSVQAIASDTLECTIGTAVSAPVGAHPSLQDVASACRRLVSRADMALEAAKSGVMSDRQSALFCSWTEDVGAAVARRRSLERDILTALEEGQFHLVYQPILDQRTASFECAEALLRWTHPRLGAVGPDEFVTVAERQGLMSEIGSFVISEATRACAEWPEHCGVAVNVSPRQFNAPGLISTIRGALDEAGLAPERLTVEITESVAIADEDAARRALASLRTMGVRTALDDFGTGHSSLGMLHSLPLDKLKLDRAFVRALGDDCRDATGLALVTHISRLAHDLGLELVIEGVEEEVQIEALTACANIDHVQGWLYAKPMTAYRAGQMLGTSISAGEGVTKVMVAA